MNVGGPFLWSKFHLQRWIRWKKLPYVWPIEKYTVVIPFIKISWDFFSRNWNLWNRMTPDVDFSDIPWKSDPPAISHLGNPRPCPTQAGEFPGALREKHPFLEIFQPCRRVSECQAAGNGHHVLMVDFIQKPFDNHSFPPDFPFKSHLFRKARGDGLATGHLSSSGDCGQVCSGVKYCLVFKTPKNYDLYVLRHLY